MASTTEATVAEHLQSNTELQPRSAVYSDILTMLPRRLTVDDISVIHSSADTYVCTAAAATGSTVYTLVPLSHESYGCLGQPAQVPERAGQPGYLHRGC